jgi:hypothetical protein
MRGVGGCERVCREGADGVTGHCNRARARRSPTRQKMRNKRSRMARPITVVYPRALRQRDVTSARSRAGLIVSSVYAAASVAAPCAGKQE